MHKIYTQGNIKVKGEMWFVKFPFVEVFFLTQIFQYDLLFAGSSWNRKKGISALNCEVHVFASVISYVNLCNRFSYFRIFEWLQRRFSSI